MNDDAYVERARVLLRGLESENAENADISAAAYSSSDPSGYYGCLGVSPKATPQEVRRAFLFLSQRYHTDKHSNQSETAQSLMNDRFQQLQNAYTVLSDERQRAAYDAGGATGIERLSLVPVGLHRREDILSYVLSLEREAQLLQTAKMASASSQTTLNFSTAHFFPFLAPEAAAAEAGGEAEGEEGQDEKEELQGVAAAAAAATATATTAVEEGRADATVQPTTGASAQSSSSEPAKGQRSSFVPSLASPSAPFNARATPAGSADTSTASAAAESKKTATTPQGAPGVSTTGGASSTEAPHGSVNSNRNSGGPTMAAHVTAKEIEVDGRRQIVLIPSADVQRQLRQRMHAESDVSSSGGASASSSSFSSPKRNGAGRPRGSPPFRRLTPAQSVLLAVIPKSVAFRSSFQHMLTPKLVATFRTDAMTLQRSNNTSLTTSVEYQPDDIRTYESSLRFTVTALKWCLQQHRALTPLWAMKSKLTAFKGAQLLQKLELTLIRKLSPTTELESAVAMSLNEHGFFRSSVNDLTADVQQGVSAYIGFHTMFLSAFTGGKVILGVDTKDPKNPPAYGRLRYTINCSPLAGQTTLGVEALYCPSNVQQYGLSFSTVLPYSISPIAPPLFLVESTQFAVVNQISLLYVRGPHRISVPIIVFISPKVSQGLAWMSVPLAVYRIATMLYRPYSRARAIHYYTQQRKLHIAETDVAREKARLEQLALESLVLMSRASEERKGGLVILNARYGVIEPQFAEVATPPRTPVVTRTPTPLPCAANSSSTPTTPPPPSSGPANTSGSPPRRRTKAAAAAAGGGRGGGLAASKGWWPSQILARVAERLVNGWLRRRASAAAREREGVGDGDGDAYEAAHDAVRQDAIPLVIDVTIAVQNLVRDSALTLPAGTKSTLVGFCDPDPYTPEQKSLKVVYWFRKRKHTAIFADDEAVELPQREHLMT
ncbi:putative mitochondrial chaperone protein DNAj [Leptomonas pyrrhocoris]|uniref:Putative mitochondrial chaperone protein DNAj n=1 Tax=Leptomonas pyrrhocoris TaxID=157538 RepID=A0A0M9GBL6_LEPPY|nr:putative mitochondrial chaperone protein DNAj [Leptomonas pyrrhocoris]KPA86836.1 putative mitochondrial chaperone protein DNAj [Leptomonas pyrrhocoris]|eukprot:XP_015665275.1 putative mitochondrial chaperone protein DNAj [Leptomonas pyrrhocoris]